MSEGAKGSDADLARVRGAALIDGLDAHVPGAREHADATAAYAFAAAVELGATREEALLAREIGRLHDVGRVYLDPGLAAVALLSATRRERRALARHPEAGAGLATGAGVPESVCAAIRAVARPPGPDDTVAVRAARAACRLHELVTLAARERKPGGPLDWALAELLDSNDDEVDREAAGALARALSRASGG